MEESKQVLLGGGADRLTTHVDMLLYGRSGAGKTYAAGTAAHDIVEGIAKDIYVISPDPTGHKALPYQAHGKVVASKQDISDVLQMLLKGGHGYKVLLFDGLLFTADIFAKEMGQLFFDTKGSADPDLMPISGRIKVLAQYRAMLRAFLNLTQLPDEEDRMHVIFTALEQAGGEEDDEGKTKGVRPFIGTKSMNETFNAFFSIIGYVTPVGTIDKTTGKINKDRRICFTEVNGILARDRLGVFPDILEPAVDLWKYLELNKIKKETR